jgi:hypothetical protein
MAESAVVKVAEINLQCDLCAADLKADVQKEIQLFRKSGALFCYFLFLGNGRAIIFLRSPLFLLTICYVMLR